MLTLKRVKDNLLLTRKRCRLVVGKSIIAGINANDESVEWCCSTTSFIWVNYYLAYLPNDKEQLMKVCMKANDVFAEKI